MTKKETKYCKHAVTDADFISVFDKFSEGVLVTDLNGVIIYYNRAMSRIDELDPREALHKKITDVYHLTNDDSIIMQCLFKGEPIIDRPIYYRTRMGKVANTVHSAFPLTRNSKIIGIICFVRDYNVLAETIADMPVVQTAFDTDIFFDSIIGEDPELIKAVSSAKMAANTPSPVMLYGQTGTGKELFARAIHNHSARSRQKYTPVNCAAIPENLLEGILFGTSKGAFTGSVNKAGLFEKTHGGTIFLDELNSMPVGLQSKILRVLQERKVRRVGALKETTIDVKIISSVNEDPHVAMANGTLRSDLFYRLGVVFIHIVPLAGRMGDLDLLVSHFINKHNKLMGKAVKGVSDNVMVRFRSYHWPGNVRELEHAIEGAMNIVGASDTIQLRHLQSHFSVIPAPAPPAPVEDAMPPPAPSSPLASGRPRPPSLIEKKAAHEKDTVHDALTLHAGNIARAAASLGISRQLLYYKMKKYKMLREDYLQ
ncbi:arginine utilization regulatory protein [Desulfocicer vacuolatum DSM 3385]|uniref:Arginine utilization regulatory protein n=1 Tax=Desulfocicer vacuolatum DSM 3385 TaxID=1121400 RepID=A0A1W2CAT2_9BACT|nr:sigma 54-interacting transcriptional regulator [Desulfocicer vacuolatum]SMC82259.1 arginine utilization regulatory protein [Desulfocicer vacuolatum DSM 3385]